MRTSFKKTKTLTILYLLLLIIGIVIGIMYFKNINLSKINIQNSNIYKINHLHIISSILIVCLTFIYIGIILGYFSVILEGFSIGLSFSLYCAFFKFKGLIYSIINLLIYKTFYLILLYLLLQYLKKSLVSYKKNEYVLFFKNFKRSLLIILIIIINEFIIGLLGENLLKYFSLLIK